ncbi:Alpha/beta hydrolase fold-3, partial [Zopfia rhizophila CBS 207.26]
HGGGFVLGDVNREDSLCSTLADETGSIIVSVGYRHAPEHPFPVPVEDAYAGVLWTDSFVQVLDNVQELGGDPSLIYTMGNSAGGNLATVVVRKLRDSDISQGVAAQVLRIPNTCHPKALPAAIAGPSASYNNFTDAPILSTSVMNEFWSLYNVPEEKIRSLDCSPLLGSEFERFPPTYISVCGCDPLRDEGLAYAGKLEEHGVPVKLDVIPGYPHGRCHVP